MSAQKKRILFVSSEMTPFLNESPVSAVARFLPQAIQEKENEIRVLVPRFGIINERRNRLHEVVRLSGINISIDDNDNPLLIKVASIPEARMQVYFLDNEDYFHRKFVFKDEKNKFFSDNDERTIFFCKGVLETVKKLGWAPDIIHCQGWMTSLIPVYLKTLYKDEPVFKNSKIIYSVFDNEFKEDLGKDFGRKASLNEIEDKHFEAYANGDNKSLHIGGMKNSDAIVNCSDKLDPDLEKLLKTKPNMNHQNNENLGERYSAFYEQVLSSAK
ncbi:MAG: glycogen/starch synthase [Bacteroidota bacterium]